MECGFFSLLLRGKSGALWSAPLVYLLTGGSEQPLVQAVHGCCLSVLEASGRITCSACCVSRCLHFALVSFSPFRCLGVACGVRRNRDACAAWFDSGFFFYGRLRTNFSIFHGAVNSNPEAVLLHPVSVEKCAQSMLLVAVSLSRGSHVGIWTLFLRVLHVLAVAAVFCCPVQLEPSMMRSSASSRAPCKSVSVTLHRWSVVVIHISHFYRL